MDRPPIQYARAKDGVSIAYWTLGTGLPLLVRNTIMTSYTLLDWEYPALADFYRRLAEHRQVIVLDPRGCGLSDRAPGRYDQSDYGRDIDAVLAVIDPGPVSIFAMLHSCATAVAFAVARPTHVTDLTLLCPFTNQAALQESASYRAMRAADEVDTDFAQEVRLLLTAGRMDPGILDLERRATAALDPEAFGRRRDFDLTELLPRVAAPTVVCGVPGSRYVGPRPVAAVAARIPGARLVSLEGRSVFWPDLADQLIPLLTGRPRSRPGGSAFRTVLFTDLAASTATTQRLGDSASHDLIRVHNGVVRPAVREHGGHEIKHTGDGIMAWFPAASNALDCAQAIQRALAAMANPDLGVKIGVNAGEPIAEEDDLYGTAVQIAARVTDQAGPGEIVCTNVVRELVAGKAYLFSEREPARLKGVEEPVRLFVLGEA